MVKYKITVIVQEDKFPYKKTMMGIRTPIESNFNGEHIADEILSMAQDKYTNKKR